MNSYDPHLHKRKNDLLWKSVSSQKLPRSFLAQLLRFGAKLTTRLGLENLAHLCRVASRFLRSLLCWRQAWNDLSKEFQFVQSRKLHRNRRARLGCLESEHHVANGTLN